MLIPRQFIMDVNCSQLPPRDFSCGMLSCFSQHAFLAQSPGAFPVVDDFFWQFAQHFDSSAWSRSRTDCQLAEAGLAA
jgi:hypothetical protein